MLFYALLAVATLVTVAFAWLLFWKTGSMAFPVGFAAFYFWSFHGGWSIVTDNLGGDSGKRYHYLLEKVTSVYLDRNYAISLILYLLFVVAVAVVAYFTVIFRSRRSEMTRALPLCHKTILFGCTLTGLISHLLIHSELANAALDGISGYIALSRSENEFYTLHKLLTRMAVLPLSIGIAVYASGATGKKFVGRRGPTLAFWYVAIAAILSVMCFLKGQKNELFQGLLTGSLVYIHNVDRPKLWRFFLCGLLFFGFIGYVDSTRGYSIHELSEQLSWEGFVESYERILSSNEAFAAHISMNAVLVENAEITYGASIWSLCASVVPRIIWPDRPEDVYAHYAREIDAVEGQGYVIHHATGWYLNFGIWGVLFGGALVGFLWGKLFNMYRRGFLRRSQSLTGRVFASSAFLVFSGGMQLLVRGGPEAYKSIALNCFAAPVTILLFSAVTQQSKGLLGRRSRYEELRLQPSIRRNPYRLKSGQVWGKRASTRYHW